MSIFLYLPPQVKTRITQILRTLCETISLGPPSSYRSRLWFLSLDPTSISKPSVILLTLFFYSNWSPSHIQSPRVEIDTQSWWTPWRFLGLKVPVWWLDILILKILILGSWSQSLERSTISPSLSTLRELTFLVLYGVISTDLLPLRIL